jgi:hypothetical protein
MIVYNDAIGGELADVVGEQDNGAIMIGTVTFEGQNFEGGDVNYRLLYPGYRFSGLEADDWEVL